MPSASCQLLFADKNYLKKLGLISCNIAPEAPSIASQIATFTIFALPSFGFPDAHCTPPIMMNINETIRIAVTTIFESPPMRAGNALSASSFFIHLPINGTSVFNLIPSLHSSSEPPFSSHPPSDGLGSGVPCVTFMSGVNPPSVLNPSASVCAAYATLLTCNVWDDKRTGAE